MAHTVSGEDSLILACLKNHSVSRVLEALLGLTVFFQQKTAGRTPLPPPPLLPAVTHLSSRCLLHRLCLTRGRPGLSSVLILAVVGGPFLRARLSPSSLPVSPSPHARMASRCAAFTWVLACAPQGEGTTLPTAALTLTKVTLLLLGRAHSLVCACWYRVGVNDGL